MANKNCKGARVLAIASGNRSLIDYYNDNLPEKDESGVSKDESGVCVAIAVK